MANFMIEQLEFAGTAEIPMNKAMKGPNAEEWRDAMALEMEAIIINKTWILVDRPKNQDVIGSRIVLRDKQNQDGTIERRKARTVARGFFQTPGVDFRETFAPVARLNSIRVIIALVAEHNMEIRQLDVTSAFLNGELEEQIFMEAPKFIDQALEKLITSKKKGKIVDQAKEMLTQLKNGDKVCLLKKALYGLRQASRQWHVKFSHELKHLGFQQSTADPCIYYKGKGEDLLLIAVYVDDILAASRKLSMITELTTQLSKTFKIKDLGKVKFCLGIEFNQNKNGIKMSQEKYVNEILEKFEMSDSKPVTTPIDCSVKLQKGKGDSDQHLPYRELIGSLMYLAVCTRPDIAFATSYLSQFCSCYDITHWTAAKRVLRYLKGTSNIGIFFKSSGECLTGYADADWANCLDDRSVGILLSSTVARYPGKLENRELLLSLQLRPSTWPSRMQQRRQSTFES